MTKRIKKFITKKTSKKLFIEDASSPIANTPTDADCTCAGDYDWTEPAPPPVTIE